MELPAGCSLDILGAHHPMDTDCLPCWRLSRPLEQYHVYRVAHIKSHQSKPFPPNLGKTHLDIFMGCV